MIKVFDSLHKVSPIPLVVFTGGEATLFLREVLATLHHIAEHSDTSSRLVTNASWAASLTAARRVLRSLKEAGLGNLTTRWMTPSGLYTPDPHRLCGGSS